MCRDGSALVYSTAGDRCTIPLGELPLGCYQSREKCMKFIDLARETFERKDMDISLSGNPDDWASLDPKAPGLCWFKDCPSDAEPPYGPGMLRAGYARVLFSFVSYFTSAFGMQAKGPDGQTFQTR